MTAPASPERMTRLLEVFKTLTQELDLDRLLQLIMANASRLVDAERSTLFVVDHEKQELWSKVAEGVDVKEIRAPIGSGIAGIVAKTGEVINSPDAYADPRFNPEVDRQTAYRTRTILCVPVRDRGGRVVAVLQALNKRGGGFTPADEALLQALASPVAIALRNAEQMEQLDRRRRTSEILLDVMKSFSAELDVDQLLKKIIARMSEVMNAERGTLFLVDKERQELWSRVAEGTGMTEIRIPIDQGVAGAVATTGQMIAIADAYADPRFDRRVDERTGYRTRTILCAPVRNAEGEIVGVAQVLNKRDGGFTREDAELLSALAAQAFIALDNARLFDTVLYMKNYNESILRCMATGVMTIAPDGRVTSVNPAFRKIFGLPHDVPPDTNIARLLGEGANAALGEQLQRYAREGTAYTAYDLTYVSQAGDAVNMNLDVVPLLNRKNKLLGIVAVAEDITQEQRLMNTLCRYVTREIAEYVLQDKEKLKLGGSRQDVAILFADIRDFTRISEECEPEELVTLLNDYFTLMVQEIFAEQGTLDKFIGDAVMAVFGVPIKRDDDAVRAVRAALGMRRSLARFNARQAEQGKPTLEIGIGIGQGEAISGNVGSEQRMEFTVIGDPVNVASRLEGLTKTASYKLLVNEAIALRVGDHFECVFVGEGQVKGRVKPVRIYGIPDQAAPD